jgi:serine/threonine-protein kinase
VEAWWPEPGAVVAGRYRVERLLGAGGMAAVVAAQHVGLAETVAIKILSPSLTAQKGFVERFVREARVMARIKNEHVVRVLDVGTGDNGVPFIAMELLEGEDLGRLVARGPLPIELAVDCVLQAAVGLSHAHDLGVVHRDVKPSNLWLARRPDGSPLVKVLDFGISKLDEGDEDKRLTDTRATFGSPGYMSPEQIRSAKHVHAATDAWAIGVVLFELLTAKLPFDGVTSSAVLAAIAADPAPPLRSVRADAPPAIEAAILLLLEKNVEKRASLFDLARRIRPFASAAGRHAADLLAASPSQRLSRESVSAPSPISSPTAFGNTLPMASSRRSPGMWLAAAAVAVVASVGAAAFVMRARTVVSPAASRSNEVASAEPAPPPSVVAAIASAVPAPSSVPPRESAGTRPRSKPRPHDEAPRTATVASAPQPPPPVAPDPVPSAAPPLSRDRQ